MAIKYSCCLHDSSCESAILEAEGVPKGKQRNSSMSRRRYPECSPNAGTLMTRESGTGIEDTCGVYMIRYGRRNSVIKLIALPYVPGGPAIKGAKFLAKKSREGMVYAAATEICTSSKFWSGKWLPTEGNSQNRCCAISRDEHAPETTDDEGIVDSIIDGELARALSDRADGQLQTTCCIAHFPAHTWTRVVPQFFR